MGVGRSAMMRASGVDVGTGVEVWVGVAERLGGTVDCATVGAGVTVAVTLVGVGVVTAVVGDCANGIQAFSAIHKMRQLCRAMRYIRMADGKWRIADGG
jgi:hypothetical protein